MASLFRGVLEFFTDIGIYDVVLPFLLVFAILFAILFLSRFAFESRFIAIAAWLFTIVFVGTGRVVIRAIQRSLLKFGIGEHRIILIGDTKSATAIQQLFKHHYRFGFHIERSFKTFDEGVAKKILSLRRRGKADEIPAHKLDRLRLRGLSGANDEFLMAATVQNLRRMAQWLSTGPPQHRIGVSA